MKKEFIPYKQALALKELEFDEPCFGYCLLSFKKDIIKEGIKGCVNSALEKNEIALPLYQQAFRFFREKYNIQSSIIFYSESLGIKKILSHYQIQIDYLSNGKWCYFETLSDDVIYKTYEEAELACLIKLIEICQKK